MGNLKHSGNHRSTPTSGKLSTASAAPKLWGYMSFAQSWFEDAERAALAEPNRDNTRREIVASVCFLESYIFEWVRSIDLKLSLEYFPPEKRFERDPRFRRNLKDKWKEIPKALFDDGHIPCDPMIDKSDLGTLLQYRHGLVHATASRPFNESVPHSHRPKPDPGEFAKLENGWALDIAAKIVRDLHAAIETICPEYVQGWLGRET